MAFTRESLKRSGRGKVIETIKNGLIQNDKDLVKIASLSIGEVEEVDIDSCLPFPEHTYKEYDEVKMKELENSIKMCGLQTPIILWDNGGDKYIILAGHNRLRACKNIGYKKIPAIIKKNLSKNEAAIIVNQTNMVQRSFDNLSIYEKCSSIYQMKKAKEEFEKEHPEKFDYTGEKKSKEIQGSLKSISREFGVSRSLISYYLRLYDMFNKSAFVLMEDTKERKKIIDTNTAVKLCELGKNTLKDLITYLKENPGIKKISKQQAKELVELFKKNNKLENKDFNKVLIFSKEEKKKAKPISLNNSTIRDYFAVGTSDADIEKEILNLLKENRSKIEAIN